MNIGIVGLGLIGGSLARAFKHDTTETVFGYDIDRSVLYKAKLLEAIDKELTPELLSICDVLLIALYPRDTVRYVKENCQYFKKGLLVMDCCGVKEFVCSELMPLAKKKGFCFIGGHPMAGIERSGFDHSNRTLFQNASMVLVPPEGVSIETLERVKKFWGAIGFSNLAITTAAEHDRIIAYTSQLAHVVASAFIKSPTALEHTGFSAGSYKDMTRVARLNETMWTELFLENRAALCGEIDFLIDQLRLYSDAIREGNEEELFRLLKEGRELKQKADRKDLKE